MWPQARGPGCNHQLLPNMDTHPLLWSHPDIYAPHFFATADPISGWWAAWEISRVTEITDFKRFWPRISGSQTSWVSLGWPEVLLGRAAHRRASREKDFSGNFGRLSKVPRPITARLSVWVWTTTWYFSREKWLRYPFSGWGVLGQIWRRWRCGSRSSSWRTWLWSLSWTSTRPSSTCKERLSANRFGFVFIWHLMSKLSHNRFHVVIPCVPTNISGCQWFDLFENVQYVLIFAKKKSNVYQNLIFAGCHVGNPNKEQEGCSRHGHLCWTTIPQIPSGALFEFTFSFCRSAFKSLVTKGRFTLHWNKII